MRLLTGLPLLRKELVEQAARKRTYALRVGLGVLLLLFLGQSLIYVYWTLSAPPEVVGQGKWLFQMLVSLLFAVIFLLFPAMTASAITAERERGSLDLLRISRLRIVEVLLEKFLARLIPMWTLLLVSLPLLAFCYSFGGLTADHIWVAAYTLVLASLQVGAFSLLVSTLSRSTLHAVVIAYLAGLGFYVVMHYSLELLLGNAGMLFPPDVYSLGASKPSETIAASLPIAISVVVFLVLAWWVLQRDAWLRPRKAVTRPWQERVRRRFRSRRHRGLPRDAPVAWRERGTDLLLGFVVALEVVLLTVSLTLVGRTREAGAATAPQQLASTCSGSPRCSSSSFAHPTPFPPNACGKPSTCCW